MTSMLRRLFLLSVVLSRTVAWADVSLAPLFRDGAVLQRDRIVPVWGKGAPGEKVTVSFAPQRREATTGPDGHWRVLLDALPTNSVGADLVVSGQNTIVVRDVVVGEVWLCSGQSNMQFPVSRTMDAAREIAAARYPLIRHIQIERVGADDPADTVPTTGWQRATPEYVGAFTAVGYFFARDLFQKLGVPIGLIHSSWGGTPVEAWMSPAALASDPAFRVVDERWAQTLAEFPARQNAFEAELAAWTSAEAAANAKGKAAQAAFVAKNPQPRAPRGPNDPWTPRRLFNGMINPLLPYALRGAIWYQGESNVGRAGEYQALFRAMITAWRAHFGQGDFPFYWVNLANFNQPNDSSGTSWAVLRDAQTRTLALPNTGQAIAIDIGDANDIHPTNKQEVGRRLALLARVRTYELTGDDSGPVYAGIRREGPALRVLFKEASGGLIAHGKPVQSLQLAGADRVYHPATGRIDRDTLIVSASAVREPVAVRYAWGNAPEANLYNGAGLPAVPFRSDDW